MARVRDMFSPIRNSPVAWLLPWPLQPIREAPWQTLVSMLAGFFGLSFLPIVGSLVAIVTGHQALRLIDAQPARFVGRGMALTGLVTGYAGLVLGVVGLLFLLVMIGIPLALHPFGH